MAKKLGVCLVGCGNVSVPHLNAYSELPDAEVVACCDMNETAAKKRAGQFGVHTIYTDYKEAFKNTAVEVVDICVPAWIHSKVAVDAMEAGKHVLCEKPLATSLKDADEILRTARRTKVKFMVGQSTRYIPLFSEAKKQVDHNKIGQPLLIRFATRWFNPILQWSSPEGRKKYAGQPIGPIVDAGIHSFDFIRWILQEEPKNIYAEVDTYPEPLPIYTQMNITLEFDSAVGFIELSRTTKGYPSYDRILDIMGSKGRISGFDNSVWTHAKPKGTLKIKVPSTPTANIPFTENIPYPSEFYFEISEFLQSIVKDEPVPISPEDSRRALIIALAAQKSAEEGKVIEFSVESG